MAAKCPPGSAFLGMVIENGTFFRLPDSKTTLLSVFIQMAKSSFAPIKCGAPESPFGSKFSNEVKKTLVPPAH